MGDQQVTMSGDGESAVREELVRGSPRLYIIFGGVAGNIGMPPYEFYRTTRILDDSKIYFRDPRRSWYQRGLPGIGGDVYAIRDFLRGRIEEAAPSQVRFIGNSMGGYAAILFCSLLRCGKAVAFAPQTFLGREKRTRYGDDRWQDKIDELYRHRSSSHIYDLREHLREHDPDIQADIHVSRSYELDRVHADELRGFANIRVREYAPGGHALVRHLRDTGALLEIIGG